MSSSANPSASAERYVWSISSTRRRSNMSAMTPARGAASIGAARRPRTIDTCRGEPVISNASQPSVIC